ncbi:MAG TPA: D-cysteine desulfhydrase family protein [Spirochaetales bacterium]|nr:D-cysteine desulfhydrase family protein [Spirochaetales bacterium]
MRQVPRIHFAHLPTPIEKLVRLSDELEGPQIYVKRDDATGLAFGGNKTRKLEFLVADALEKGAQTLITAGAAQSNHCRQTAAAAAKFGLKCILVLNGAPPDTPSANLLLDKLFGARIMWVADRKDREHVQEEAFKKLEADGEKPYFIPYGGSSPVGALGYAFAVQETLRQRERFDWYVFGTSSGGTHAGLVLGSRVFGFKGKVLGISIDESEAWLKEHVSALASQASGLIGNRIDFAPDDVLANDAYCKPGYGVLTSAEKDAIRLFARTEGLLLDPVYTARAAAGMIDLIRKGFFGQNEKVLFWNTGGQPALFADQYAESLL